MLELDKCTTSKEIIQWLEGASRTDIIALCAYLNNRTKYRIPTSGTKDQLLHGLRDVKASVLREAVDLIFPDADDDDETDDDDFEDSDDVGDEDEDEDEEDEAD